MNLAKFHLGFDFETRTSRMILKKKKRSLNSDLFDFVKGYDGGVGFIIK
jgi:hypothetical protein